MIAFLLLASLLTLLSVMLFPFELVFDVSLLGGIVVPLLLLLAELLFVMTLVAFELFSLLLLMFVPFDEVETELELIAFLLLASLLTLLSVMLFPFELVFDVSLLGVIVVPLLLLLAELLV